MPDIIIHKPDDVSDGDALYRVLAVIREGRISRNGECYCYVTTFSDGITVFADKKKADIFTVKGPIDDEEFHKISHNARMEG